MGLEEELMEVEEECVLLGRWDPIFTPMTMNYESYKLPLRLY